MTFGPQIASGNFATEQARQPGHWRRELSAFARAFSGAYLFGIPLLYTMEMWWLGEWMSTARMLAILGVMLLANLGLVYAGGFRHADGPQFGHLDDAVDAVAVGLVGAAVVLLLLNQIGPDQPLQVNLGRVVALALPLSLGASLANAVFRKGADRAGNDDDTAPEPGTWKPLLKDVGATAIGAVFVASSIGPTEEIPMIAAALSYPHLLGLVGFTLLVGYGIVFASGFDPESWGGRRRPGGAFQHPWAETALAYLVSLVVAAGILALVQNVGGEDPPLYVLKQALVLGLPAMIGGAAGRLAI